MPDAGETMTPNEFVLLLGVSFVAPLPLRVAT